MQKMKCLESQAENERLQQQLKEKETERIYWLNLAHETQIELKSAQELNRELVEELGYLGYQYTLPEKLASLIQKYKSK